MDVSSEMNNNNCLQDSTINDPSIDIATLEAEATDPDLQNDILVAVLRAFQLMEETNASHKSFMNILNFGRDLYCKGDPDIIKRWPNSWSMSLDLLKENGYKEPTTYYVCLNPSHYNQWSILNNSGDMCKYCNQPGSIQYHYLIEYNSGAVMSFSAKK